MSALEEGEPILDVVGDGGFRASVPGKGRQSGHAIPPTEWLPPGAWGSTRGHSILKQHAQQASTAGATAGGATTAGAAATSTSSLPAGVNSPKSAQKGSLGKVNASEKSDFQK